MIARRLSISDGLLSIAKEETEHTEGGGIEFTEVIRRNIKKGSKQHHYSSRYKFLVSVFSVSSVPLSFGVFRCAQKLGGPKPALGGSWKYLSLYSMVIDPEPVVAAIRAPPPRTFPRTSWRLLMLDSIV